MNVIYEGEQGQYHQNEIPSPMMMMMMMPSQNHRSKRKINFHVKAYFILGKINKKRRESPEKNNFGN